ncbi:MAG: LLM class F420-dependent oxidoreductase [Chloroflexi bacterium]|nr:LLM class F420-dependent oxidoreductase [Chloroflexota bacterium]
MKVSVGLHRYAIEDWEETTRLALEAERLGVDSLWTAEAWAHDAATPLAYLAAKTTRLKLGTGIMQVGTRTPALVAMTAMTLDSMSGGRFLLGLGTSGPQVIEGWHGNPFDRPIQRTREIIEICRRIFQGETLAYEGQLYTLPLPGGEGKALRPGAPPTPNLKIYVASLGPRNLRMTGELADGWLGTSFLPETAETFIGPIREGARAAGRSLAELDLQAGGTVWFTDDPERAAEALKPGLAFSLGAMGSQQHNFYNDAYRRQGFADEAREVQRLWLSGHRDEARRRVPTELVLSTNLIGDEETVRARLRDYRDAGITTFRAGLRGTTLDERLETLGRVIGLVEALNREGAPASAPGQR